MKAIWLNPENKWILGRNAKGELINPQTKFIYQPALAEAVKKSVISGFKRLELALTDIEDANLKTKYVNEINALKEQAKSLKLT